MDNYNFISDNNALIQRWYDASKENASTDARIKLYEDTENAAKYIEQGIVGDEKISMLCTNLLQSFSKHQIKDTGQLRLKGQACKKKKIF